MEEELRQWRSPVDLRLCCCCVVKRERGSSFIFGPVTYSLTHLFILALIYSGSHSFAYSLTHSLNQLTTRLTSSSFLISSLQSYPLSFHHIPSHPSLSFPSLSLLSTEGICAIYVVQMFYSRSARSSLHMHEAGCSEHCGCIHPYSFTPRRSGAPSPRLTSLPSPPLFP